jgi:quinol monooxygenase YgiN
MSPSSLTIVAITIAAAGKEQALRTAQEKLVVETAKEPGCLRYELNQSLDDGRVLIFTEKWASEREWRAHMEGAAMKHFHASGGSRSIEDFSLFRMATIAGAQACLMLVQKNLVRKEMVDITANVTAPIGAGNDALPELKNPDALEWVKTIPGLGKNSPEYAILHVDPRTRLTKLNRRSTLRNDPRLRCVRPEQQKSPDGRGGIPASKFDSGIPYPAPTPREQLVWRSAVPASH